MQGNIQAGQSLTIKKVYAFRVNTPGVRCSVTIDKGNMMSVAGCQVFRATPGTFYKQVVINSPNEAEFGVDYWYTSGPQELLPEISPSVLWDGSIYVNMLAPYTEFIAQTYQVAENVATKLGGFEPGISARYFIQNLGSKPILVSDRPDPDDTNSLVVAKEGGTLTIVCRTDLYIKHRVGDGEQVSPADTRVAITVP